MLARLVVNQTTATEKNWDRNEPFNLNFKSQPYCFEQPPHQNPMEPETKHVQLISGPDLS